MAAGLHVDLGLLTLARARVTLTTGILVSKDAALAGLPGLGVPDRLVREITQRRSGAHVQIGALHRLRRAGTARRLVCREITALLGLPEG